jgi:hypothetical protein
LNGSPLICEYDFPVGKSFRPEDKQDETDCIVIPFVGFFSVLFSRFLYLLLVINRQTLPFASVGLLEPSAAEAHAKRASGI